MFLGFNQTLSINDVTLTDIRLNMCDVTNEWLPSAYLLSGCPLLQPAHLQKLTWQICPCCLAGSHSLPQHWSRVPSFHCPSQKRHFERIFLAVAAVFGGGQPGVAKGRTLVFPGAVFHRTPWRRTCCWSDASWRTLRPLRLLPCRPLVQGKWSSDFFYRVIPRDIKNISVNQVFLC